MLTFHFLSISPFCKSHGHLHRCYTKGHFKICPKHGYHSTMNGCFHCIRVERAEMRDEKKAGSNVAGKAIFGSEAGSQGDAKVDANDRSKVETKVGKQGSKIKKMKK